MSKKTERLYARFPLVGDTLDSTEKSVSMALGRLHSDATKQDREVLYDTLTIETERNLIDNSTMFGDPQFVTNVTINVSAEAVKR